MFGLRLSAISCHIKRAVLIQLVSIILIVLFKYFVFSDSFGRAAGEAFILTFISLAVWFASNRIAAGMDCRSIISKDCESILRSARDNGCTSAELPDTVYI